jgi:hypothetical protein
MEMSNQLQLTALLAGAYTSALLALSTAFVTDVALQRLGQQRQRDQRQLNARRAQAQRRHFQHSGGLAEQFRGDNFGCKRAEMALDHATQAEMPLLSCLLRTGAWRLFPFLLIYSIGGWTHLQQPMGRNKHDTQTSRHPTMNGLS